MKRILILGAGTAGTMMANKLHRTIDPEKWQITIVDQDEKHYYQPGFLFVPFGIYDEKGVVGKKKDFLPKDVETVFNRIAKIDPSANRIELQTGETINYDILIIATGNDIVPSEIEGLKGELWHKEIFDFYTAQGAVAMAEFLKSWQGGTMVINVAEMPSNARSRRWNLPFLLMNFLPRKACATR